MPWATMVITMTGGRHTGDPWPAVGERIYADDWEYERLIAGKVAIPAPDPLPGEPGFGHGTYLQNTVLPPDPEPARVPDPGPGEAAVKDPEPPAGGKVGHYEGDQLVPEPGPEDDEEPEPPRPADSKADWIAWAVSQGASEDAASAMTKADLMSKFGGRL